jgi:ABC-2 type transport system permease protein
MSANAHLRPAPPRGWAAVRAADRSCSAGALRGRRLLGLGALVGLPILVQLALLVWGEGRGSSFANFSMQVSAFYLRIILPLALIFLGTAAFGDEWEGGTANYVIGTPVPRGLLVLGRYLASVRRALVLVLPVLAVLYLLCVAPHEGAFSHYLPDAGAVLLFTTLGILAYCAVFVCLGLWLKRSIMSAFIYVLVFEGLLGNLPSGFASLSISFHARNLMWRATDDPGFRPELLQQLGLEPPTATVSLVTLVVFVVVFLSLSTVLLGRKEFTGSGQQADAAPGT